MTQPQICPFCNSNRIGIDGAVYVFDCYTKLVIAKDRKPHAKQTLKCIALAKAGGWKGRAA